MVYVILAILTSPLVLKTDYHLITLTSLLFIGLILYDILVNYKVTKNPKKQKIFEALALLILTPVVGFIIVLSGAFILLPLPLLMLIIAVIKLLSLFK